MIRILLLIAVLYFLNTQTVLSQTSGTRSSVTLTATSSNPFITISRNDIWQFDDVEMVSSAASNISASSSLSSVVSGSNRKIYGSITITADWGQPGTYDANLIFEIEEELNCSTDWAECANSQDDCENSGGCSTYYSEIGTRSITIQPNIINISPLWSENWSNGSRVWRQDNIGAFTFNFSTSPSSSVAISSYNFRLLNSSNVVLRSQNSPSKVFNVNVGSLDLCPANTYRVSVTLNSSANITPITFTRSFTLSNGASASFSESWSGNPDEWRENNTLTLSFNYGNGISFTNYLWKLYKLDGGSQVFIKNLATASGNSIDVNVGDEGLVPESSYRIRVEPNFTSNCAGLPSGFNFNFNLDCPSSAINQPELSVTGTDLEEIGDTEFTTYFVSEDNNTVNVSLSNLSGISQYYEWTSSSFSPNEAGAITVSPPINGSTTYPSTQNFTLTFNEIGRYTLRPSRKASTPGNSCYALPDPIIINYGGRDRNFEERCTVELPGDLPDLVREQIIAEGGDPADSPTLGDLEDSGILAHFSWKVSSETSVIIGPGITLVDGAQITIESSDQITEDDPLDQEFNYIETISFDDYGNRITQARQFFDQEGKLEQSQYVSFEDQLIWASAALEDRYDRTVLNTMDAPVKFIREEGECGFIGAIDFDYVPDFVQFDSSNPLDFMDVDASSPIADTPKTLGWYYGDQEIPAGLTSEEREELEQMQEPAVAQTNYPYAQMIYDDATGESISTTIPGDAYKKGSGREGETRQLTLMASDVVFVNDYLSQRSAYISDMSTTYRENNYFKQRSVDAQGDVSETIYDEGQNAIISTYYGDGSTVILQSMNFYDDRGRMIASRTPRGDINLYRYDFEGRLIEMEEADAGITKYRYRKDGLIRFSQNSEQATNNRYSYTNYDESSRSIESGEYIPNSTSDDYAFDGTGMLSKLEETGALGHLPESNGNKVHRIYTFYDKIDPNLLVSRKQRFTRGAVSYTKKENDITTWYSYDSRGRLEWLIQDITGLGIKTIDYEYDGAGNVQVIAYQRSSADAYYHYYEYDKNLRLTDVYSSTIEPEFNLNREIQNLEDLTYEANYSYYKHGPLKRMELPEVLQGMDYLYTLDGDLKAMNHSDPDNDPGLDGSNGFRPDVFGFSLDYHIDDYKSNLTGEESFTTTGYEDQYGGNIKAMRWHSPVDGNEKKAYAYQYDTKNQIQTANFGSSLGAAGSYSYVQAVDSRYQVSIPDYDDNGNIETLSRKGRIGNELHNFQYVYEPGTNRLDKVTDSNGTTIIDYEYNSLGQLISQQEDERSMFLEYDVSGKLLSVFSDEVRTSPVMRLVYDDRGFRLNKTSYDETGNPSFRTWYVRDFNGTILSVYVENMAEGEPAIQYELPVYGTDRIGIYRPLQQTTLYEIKDHLGNVRAVIGDVDTDVQVATMESELQSEEEQFFYINNRIPTAEFINHTPDGTPGVSLANEVVRLNNRRDTPDNVGNEGVGAGRLLSVYPDDVVTASVYVKYADFDDNNDNILPGLAGYLGSLFGLPSLGEGTIAIFDVVESAQFLTMAAWDEYDENQPRSFLNYLFFDQNLGFDFSDDNNFGFVQVSEAAQIPTEDPFNHEHEKLELTFTATKPGFLYLYVSNESDQDMDIYFDDFQVEHQFNDVVIASDYYPFGLVMDGRKIQRGNYRFGYQGEFSEKDEETDWNSFEARMYDPTIGRWTVPDPARQFLSPYNGMGNNPINGIDPDGRFLWFKSKKGADRAASNINNIFKKKFDIDNAVSVNMHEVQERYTDGFWDWITGQKSGTRTVTQYRIEANGEWDISSLSSENQFVALSFSDVLTSSTSIQGALVNPNMPNGKLGTVGDVKGFTFNSRFFAVPNDLPDYDPTRTNFNIGSQILHEVLWHISPAGNTLYNNGQSSNWLYRKTGGRTGHAHPPGSNQNHRLPVRQIDF
ncbi:MAG: RHS repeat-associated core domain-containing protein [Bacteroidota bacterium]